MIVVEGPDGGGKTTLIRVLQEITGFQVMPRRVGQDTQALVDLRSWIEEDNGITREDLLYDRHALISEPIYGPILRDEQKPCFLDTTWLTWQTHGFYSREPLVVFCLPPFEVVHQNVIDDANNIAVMSKIEAIYAAYAARAAVERHRRPSNCFIYDYTKHTPKVIVSMWRFYLDERTPSDRA